MSEINTLGLVLMGFSVLGITGLFVAVLAVGVYE
jgi:hypothetical protein